VLFASTTQTVCGWVNDNNDLLDTSAACQPAGNCFSNYFACSGHWKLSADLLYWKACQNDLNEFPRHCRRHHPIADVEYRTYTNSPHFQWNPGFRVGLGYDFSYACCDWDTAVVWTHINDHAKGERVDSSHRTHWKLRYETVDINFGRTLGVGCGFNWHPFCGIRMLWLRDKLHHHIAESQEEDCLAIAENASCVRNRLSAFGPQVGFEAEWSVYGNIGVYGSLSTGVLYGNFKNDSYHMFVADEDIECYSSKNRRCTRPATIDAGLGVKWQQYCWNDELQVQLKLGWEHHRLFNYNQVHQNGDLCLDGLVFSLVAYY
jgi:hypothetical protein